jgi:addiction module HigA family antidote
MVDIKNQFQPDYIVSPGEILEEMLESKNIIKNEFAERCGRSPKAISQVIAGIAPITPELAIRFHRVLGSSPALWNNLETNYRLQLARKAELEELKKRAAQV